MEKQEDKQVRSPGYWKRCSYRQIYVL